MTTHSAFERPSARMTRPVLGGISPFFIVAELDTALAFYRDKLGLR